MKSIHEWLVEYGQSHQDETNKTIHWICVPSIFFSIVLFLWSLKINNINSAFQLNVAVIAVSILTIYYLILSKTIWIGMLIFGLICLWVSFLLEEWNFLSIKLISLIIFVLAWIGQFYGHKIEGKKPSFLKDLQFLLIGPMWLMSFIYKNLGIKY